MRKLTRNGFTLMEVIIVVAILAITAAIAIPSIMSWMPNYRLKGAARELYSNMQRVRFEAVRRNTSVAIAFVPVVFPATGGNYRVFVDDGAGAGGTQGNAIQDGTEVTLFTVTMPQSCTLTNANFSAQTTAGYTYQGLPLNNRFGSATIRNNLSRWYRITLSIAGQVRIQVSSDGINWS